MNPSRIKPKIRIKPYCIFCGRNTKKTAKHIHHYYPALAGGIDEVEIVYPAHKLCIWIRKIRSFFGALLAGALFFTILSFAAANLFFSERTLFNLPTWIEVIFGILAVAVFLIAWIRLYSYVSNKIHEYYVLNEELPEADKEWRRRR